MPFLGIKIIKRIRRENAVSLRQRGLVDRIIKATGMQNANKTKTPATTVGLSANGGGSERRNDEWSYASVVGTLLYLVGNTRPDTALLYIKS